MRYSLNNPPLRAPLNDHAETVTGLAFRVSHRTMERWGLEMTHVQGKRQPLSSEVWAAALARLPFEDRQSLLGQMSDSFAQEVAFHLPAAQEFLKGAV